jgi:Na+-translocating ferredoxin:NAD+ oxidoreductase RnfG subunit
VTQCTKQEICSKYWLQQFEYYDGKNPVSIGKEIDAISGATVSVMAITNDIILQMQVLKELINIQES